MFPNVPLFSAVLYKSDGPTVIFMAGEKFPTFNIMSVSKSEFLNVVSGNLCVTEVVFPTSLFSFMTEPEKIESRRLLMTLVQAHSFNNQVGWNADLLPGTTELVQTTPRDSLFITNVLHNIIFFSHSVIKISHQTQREADLKTTDHQFVFISLYSRVSHRSKNDCMNCPEMQTQTPFCINFFFFLCVCHFAPVY